MSIFDIYVAYVSWGSGGKKRPVLVLEQAANVVVVFKITTKYDEKSDTIKSKYFKITDWQHAGLSRQSYIDTNNTVTLPVSSVDVDNPGGTLTDADVQRLIEFLSQ